MWAFFRRQTYFFLLGFVVALMACVAYAVGLNDLVRYIIISAAVGIVFSLLIFFLERRFPDRPPSDFVD